MKKILSMVLSFIMIFSVIPIANVSAAETEETTPRQELEDLLEYYNTETDYTTCYWFDPQRYPYGSSVYGDYVDAKENAEALLANPDATDKDYKAAYNELVATRTSLIKEEMWLFKWFYWEFLHTPDYWYAYFTPESVDAYYAAFDAGQKVADNSDATFDDCKNAIDNFFAAQDALVQTAPIEPEPQGSPKQILTDWLDYYDSELSNQEWSLDREWYTDYKTYKEKFNSVRERAEALLTSETTTDEEYTAVLEELKATELEKIKSEALQFFDDYWDYWDMDDSEFVYDIFTGDTTSSAVILALHKLDYLIGYKGKFATIESYKEAMENVITVENNQIRKNLRKKLEDLLEYYNTEVNYTDWIWNQEDKRGFENPWVFDDYYEAEQRAQELLLNEEATDEELEAMIAELQEKRLLMIKQEAVDMANYFNMLWMLDDTMNEILWGYPVEDYHAFGNAVRKAEKLSRRDDVTIEDIKEAIDEALAAYNYLTEQNLTPKQKLERRLYEYNRDLDYTDQDWEIAATSPKVYQDYFNAEKKARLLLENEEASDEEVNLMIDELQDKRLLMIKQEVEDMCLFYSKEIDVVSYPSAYWCKVYTEESFTPYLSAYNKAYKLIDSDEATISISATILRYKLAIDKCMAAYDNLIKNDDTYFDFTYGDIDKDGEVSVLDAIIAQKGVVGLNSFTDLGTKIADVDGDKDVTLKDAILIQKKTLRLVDEFPVGDSFSTTLRVSKEPPYNYIDSTIK